MATIFIIDDSPFSRRVLRQHLEGGGYIVVEAGNGLEGLERYTLDRPDVVTLDLTMTGLQGLEVLEQLRLIDPDARVLIASADIQSATRALCLAAGAVGFVQKPFLKENVLQRIAAVLRGEGAW